MADKDSTFEQLASSLEENQQFLAWYYDQKAIAHYLDEGLPVGETFELDGKHHLCFDIDKINFQRWREHGRPQNNAQVDWLHIE